MKYSLFLIHNDMGDLGTYWKAIGISLLGLDDKSHSVLGEIKCLNIHTLFF